MNHATRYEIKLKYIRYQKNSHERESLSEAPFLTIGPKSPKAWRDAMEVLAYYFRREFHYDCVPYEANHCDKMGVDRVLAFHKNDINSNVENSFYFIGAVGVQWIEWENIPHSWCVTWAWFHPYERGKGHLKEAWPFILQMFPRLLVQPPLSSAMAGFLKKMNYADANIKVQGETA